MRKILFFWMLGMSMFSYSQDYIAKCSAEWDSVKLVLMHTPGDELLSGILHPDAALFERTFSIDKAQNEHQAYQKLLLNYNARVITLKEAVLYECIDKNGNALEGERLNKLRAFTLSQIKLNTKNLPPAKAAKQQEYLRNVVYQMHPADLFKTIVQQPTITLFSTSKNTGYTAKYEYQPLMNLYFMRDQMITTAKGVILGKLNSPQRAAEVALVKFAMENIGIPIIAEITGAGNFLEGGDFIPAGGTCFIGCGLRTTEGAIQQILETQAFGHQRVVVVKDQWKNQSQMHLDTYFNLLNNKMAVLADNRLTGDPNDPLFLTCDIYELSKGKYVLTENNRSFMDYLINNLGFMPIPVSADDLAAYGANFLNLGNNTIAMIKGVSDSYAKAIEAEGIKIEWVDFSNLSGGYGAAHCTTQVLYRN